MEEIPEDLLDSIPDVDEPAWSQPTMAVEPPRAREKRFLPWETTEEPDVRALVGSARGALKTTMETELARVEGLFTGALRRLEDRLLDADAEIVALREAHQRLRAEHEALQARAAEYERRFALLRGVVHGAPRPEG